MKPVLITGTSSGIGLATAAMLHGQGYRVIATIRDRAHANRLPPGVDVIQLDLRDQQAIEELPQRLAQPIYALINNAGHNYIAPFESHDPAAARSLMETNFFGLTHLTRVLIPSLRAWHQANPDEYSRIVNISSIGGIVGIPWEAFYHASKFAVVGLTESLRQELWHEGIRATVICPGGIRTPFIDKSTAEIDAVTSTNPRYLASIAKLKALSSQVHEIGSAPDRVAKAIAKLLRQRNPAFRKLVGFDAQLMMTLSRLLPSAWFHQLLRSTFVAAPQQPLAG